jgi:hypothetical protein
VRVGVPPAVLAGVDETVGNESSTVAFVTKVDVVS